MIYYSLQRFYGGKLWHQIIQKAEHLPAKVPERVQQAVPEEPPQVQKKKKAGAEEC